MKIRWYYPLVVFAIFWVGVVDAAALFGTDASDFIQLSSALSLYAGNLLLLLTPLGWYAVRHFRGQGSSFLKPLPTPAMTRANTGGKT